LLQNAAGQFVRADAQNVAAAARHTEIQDFRSSISLTNCSGDSTYPIAGFSGFIVPEHISDARKRASLVSFLRWVLTEGQKMAVKDGYIPVPGNIVHTELQLLDTLSQ